MTYPLTTLVSSMMSADEWREHLGGAVGYLYQDRDFAIRYADGTTQISPAEFLKNLLHKWYPVLSMDGRSLVQLSWAHDRVTVDKTPSGKPIYACRVGSFMRRDYRADRAYDSPTNADIDAYKDALCDQVLYHLSLAGYRHYCYAPRSENAASQRWVERSWHGVNVGVYHGFLSVDGFPHDAVLYASPGDEARVRSLAQQWAFQHDPAWPSSA